MDRYEFSVPDGREITVYTCKDGTVWRHVNGAHCASQYKNDDRLLILEILRLASDLKAKDAELTSLKAEKEALKEALEQAVYSVFSGPCLPEDDEERPFGAATVMFDVCEPNRFAVNCPELASYLKNREALPKVDG